jgi:hypothetical protein
MYQLTTQNCKQLTKAEMQSLFAETKETIIAKNQMKNFSIVDLWAIQKTKKAVSVRGVKAF